MRFYEQWLTSFNLTEEKEENFPDYKDPDLTMLRLASGPKSPSACLFTFGHTAIVEIEWQQSDSEYHPNFWKNADNVLEDHLRNMSPCKFYIGCSRACFERSDDLSAATAEKTASICGWLINDEPASAEISGYGNLYGFGQHRYVLLSPKNDLISEQQAPVLFPDTLSNFLDRDFPLMASALHKLEFEEGELRKLKEQNQEAENQIQKLMKEGLQAVEAHFEDIRKYQTRLRQTVIRQNALRQTLQINIRNIRDIGKNYLSPENDSLFTPRIRRFRNLYGQIRYDLNYARLNAEEIESQIQLERLKIEQRREKGQRRIALLIAVVGVPLGIGGMTTNMTNSFHDWLIRFAMMGIGGAVMYAVYKRHETKDERRDK